MGALLIIVGLLVMLLLNFTVGLLLLIIGIALLFIPVVPGPTWRRRPPP